MIPTETVPLDRVTAGTIGPVGVELAIASSSTDPGGEGRTRYDVALHEDGAACPAACGCVDADERTSIWEGAEIKRGAWTWHASRYALVGWRRSGPTEAETELRERIARLVERNEELAEDAKHEQGLHQVTKLDLGHNIRAVKRLAAELEAKQSDVAQLQRNIATVCAERDEAQKALRQSVKRWAWGSGSVVFALALVLVWLVIA